MSGYWAYLGTKTCGCTVAAVVDLPDSPELTAESIAEYVRNGFTVERRWVKEGDSLEMQRCRCGEQLSLEREAQV